MKHVASRGGRTKKRAVDDTRHPRRTHADRRRHLRATSHGRCGGRACSRSITRSKPANPYPGPIPQESPATSPWRRHSRVTRLWPQSWMEGETFIAQIHIPGRFGQPMAATWWKARTPTQLNKHGLGHYTDSQMPGQMAATSHFAGHRNGYGQPLGDVDKTAGRRSRIIVRTAGLLVRTTTPATKIVLPSQVEVVAANPEHPGETPTTKRMLTMTTCEPKYSTPTHRWISYAEFSYWATRSPTASHRNLALPKRQRHSQIRQQRTVVVPVVDRYAETVDLRRARRIRDHIYFRRRRLDDGRIADVRAGRRKKADFQHLRRSAATAARRAAYSDRIAAAVVRSLPHPALVQWLPVGRVEYPALQEMSNYTAI